MSGRFLQSFFKKVEFPTVVVEEIVTTYKSKYANSGTFLFQTAKGMAAWWVRVTSW